MSLLINRRDVDFLLYELLHVESLTQRPRYTGQDRELYAATLDAAETLATEEFAAHAQKLDANEPQLVDGRVVLIPEVKQALDAYRDGGFMGASFDAEWGGMQLPWTIAQVVAFYFNAANVSTAAYPFITIAASNLLQICGSPEQQAKYLRRVVETSVGFVVGWLNWGLYDSPGAGDCSELTGLLRVDGTPKAWSLAFEQLARRYGGKQIPPAVTGARPALDWEASLTSPESARQYGADYLKGFLTDKHRW